MFILLVVEKELYLRILRKRRSLADVKIFLYLNHIHIIKNIKVVTD